MLMVVALGGNALPRRGEPMTAENQRRHARVAATAVTAMGLTAAGQTPAAKEL
jgi:carbamate kinase